MNAEEDEFVRKNEEVVGEDIEAKEEGEDEERKYEFIRKDRCGVQGVAKTLGGCRSGCSGCHRAVLYAEGAVQLVGLIWVRRFVSSTGKCLFYYVLVALHSETYTPHQSQKNSKT